MNRLLLVLGFLFITHSISCQEPVVYDVKIQGTKKTNDNFILEIFKNEE